jgi:hypothetical protein
MEVPALWVALCSMGTVTGNFKAAMDSYASIRWDCKCQSQCTYIGTSQNRNHFGPQCPPSVVSGEGPQL